MAHRHKHWSILTAALASALWLSARETATQGTTASYGVTDLGTIGGNRSTARGIAPGVFPRIVGTGTTATGDEHAFEGNASGVQDVGTLGGRRSEAFGTSDSGRAVGRAQLPSGAYHAFIYSAFEGIRDLGTLGGSESYATAINEQVVVVGASLVAGNGSTRAFIYENGVMTQLPATLGGRDVVATDINNSNDIVGYAQLPAGQSHAFLYAGGNTIDLGSLGGTSEASAINDDGIVVGRSTLAGSAVQHAFRHQNGVMHDLGTLGGSASEAFDINREGAIVGWAHTAQGAQHAFLWRDGAMVDLNSLIPPGTGWVLEAATSIGNGGAAIVGYGRLNGQVRAFLLTPPIDLAVDLSVHLDSLDTNFPNPHEAGKVLTLGVTVRNPVPLSAPYSATGVSVTDTISGPVEYLDWFGNDCVQDGQRLTCRVRPIDFLERDVFIRVRTTGPGAITHSATAFGDQPDPSPANNSSTESNLAVSLADLRLTPTTVIGGTPSLGRATLTSPTPPGGARVTLTSSRPDIASVPAEFDVLPWSGDGLFREFWVTTKPVLAPVTVQIGATYGLLTDTVPLTILPSGGQWPYGGSARPIPGTIQAEDFDEGGEGFAYHDASPGNLGGAHRSTDVDIEASRDVGGGANVGWIGAGEWLEYTVNVAATGTYILDARVASFGAGGTFHVEMDAANKTGAMTVPDTGGWQSWTTISRTVNLNAGRHVVRVSFDANGANDAVGNLNYLRFAPASTPAPTPLGGTPRAVPGTIQAEDFDEGGAGVAYIDSAPDNAGGQYRSAGVDIQRSSDGGGGFNIGWMTAGEWLNYTVSVAQSGTYVLSARVASNGAGGVFHVEVGGVDRTGPLTIPNTGGWQTWTDVSAAVTLTAGTQSMRFVATANGPAGVFGNLNYVKVASVASSDNVLRSSDMTLNRTWFAGPDASAAGGQKVLTPDAGGSSASSPLADPDDYAEAAFDAPTNIPLKQPTAVRFAASGRHTIRRQIREDGA